MLEKGITRNPGDPILPSRLAYHLFLNGDEEGAISLLRRTAKRHPASPLPHATLAGLYRRRGNWDLFFAEVRRAEMLFDPAAPSGHEAGTILAAALLDAGEVERSRQIWRTVVEHSGSSLGEIYLSLFAERDGDLREAQEHLDAARAMERTGLRPCGRHNRRALDEKRAWDGVWGHEGGAPRLRLIRTSVTPSRPFQFRWRSVLLDATVIAGGWLLIESMIHGFTRNAVGIALAVVGLIMLGGYVFALLRRRRHR